MITLFWFVFRCFVGFAVGRLGDKYGGHLNAPHHWIYGLLMMGYGIWYPDSYAMLRIAAGFGHVISDLDDLLHMRVWGVDHPHKRYFWSIK